MFLSKSYGRLANSVRYVGNIDASAVGVILFVVIEFLGTGSHVPLLLVIDVI
jgi:hypothetical protein